MEVRVDVSQDVDKIEELHCDPLDKVQNAVTDLYTFRDHYFERNNIDRAIYKTEDVGKELDKTIELIEQLSESIENKAELLMLHGKAVNVMPEFNATALEYLSKSVKLDPQLVEGWNQLGECYWKNKDVASAQHCFTGALNHRKNKISLRNLSMVLRQLGQNTSEKLKFVEESVQKAKQAVQMEIIDGTSWFILGNAYLSLFFASTQSPKILKQCMQAYIQAEKDHVANSNPDLHYNRATAYKYQEEYQLCLVGYTRASVLDPTWQEPQEKKKQLVDYLSKVQEFIRTKGKLKGKKLASLVSSLSDGDLGPYSDGSYTSPHGHTIKLEHSSISQLKPDVNSGLVISGKVVCSLVTEDPVPFTFCMVNSEEVCISVTVYNMAEGYGVKIGDSVSIPEPFVQDVEVQYNEQVFSYQSIRVDTPLVLVVNGKKWGKEKQAPSVLGVSAKSE